MTRRLVKLTVVNDFVRPTVSFSFLAHPDQVCPNCCIGQHELLTAISHCTDTLRLPLTFELEHMPFRLISTECLSDNIPPSAKVDKGTFYTTRLGKEKFANIENYIAKWAKDKGIPLYYYNFSPVIGRNSRGFLLGPSAGR